VHEVGETLSLCFGKGQRALGTVTDPDAEADVVAGDRHRALFALESLVLQIARHAQISVGRISIVDLDPCEEPSALGRSLCQQLPGQIMPTT
jgi:hypothetical protein